MESKESFEDLEKKIYTTVLSKVFEQLETSTDGLSPGEAAALRWRHNYKVCH